MKFLPLPSFDEITSALNFDTQDCHIVGGCDLYTTKAAGPDKKLYKTIEHGLESQYESLLRLSASLSPPHATTAAESLNLARSSPFGPLSEHSSRRTYAYLIATLNASHPDYDFSHLLRPSDFKREKSLKRVINTIDSTLFNLRPNMARDVGSPAPYVMSSSLGGNRGHQHAGAGTGTRLSPSGNGASPLQMAASVPPTSNVMMNSSPTAAATTTTTTTATTATTATTSSWGPRMWKLIDEQMTLNECAIYSYNPEVDPYEGDEGEEDGAMWSLKYFFFNKTRKRVCYLYLKGISVLSGSYREHRLAQGIPIGGGNSGYTVATDMSRQGYGFFSDSGFDMSSDVEEKEKDNEDSVKKRARYWLGEYAAIKMRRNIDSDDDSDFNDDEDDDDEIVGDDGKGSRAVRQPNIVDGDVEMVLDDDEENENRAEQQQQRQGPRTRQMTRQREFRRGGGGNGGNDGHQRRRSRSPRGSKSSGGVSEQMAGMMEV